MIGLRFPQWCKLINSQRGKLSASQIPLIIIVSLVILFFAPFRFLERIRYKNGLDRLPLNNDPIFIIGHWRSGTTHLHKLLSQSRSVGYASLSDVMFPHMMLGRVNRWLSFMVLKLLLPKTRGQDNVTLYPNMPHEHEYALLHMNFRTPYLIPFMPDAKNYLIQYLTFDTIRSEIKNEWGKDFLFFVKKVNLKHQGKPLFLKSPPDTARINMILNIFPNAKFVHLVRNPYRVFLSTEKMFNVYQKKYSPKGPVDNSKFILDVYHRMYNNFFKNQELIPPANYLEIRFTDLIRNPLDTVKLIYRSFAIPGIDEAIDASVGYLNSVKDYKKNRYSINQQRLTLIKKSWNSYLKYWNYKVPNSIEIIK